MDRPQHNFTSLEEFFAFLETALGYLEKTNGSDLGDFTADGKTRNAGYNNYTVYWDFYKKLGYDDMQSQAYCACAVSTMLANAFGLEKAKALLCGDLFVYCPTGYSQFNSKHKIFNSPKAGDVVFFWSDSLGRWSHTGIVIGTDNSGFTTWEANTSSGNDIVVRNGGATCRKHYTTGQRKVAFGRPDYASVGISIGNSGNAKQYLKTYEIGTDKNGLTCTCTSTLNVRQTPGNGTIIGTIKKGERVIPSEKTFVDGAPWYYIPSRKGWVSAKYFTGWVKEISDCGKWWYLLTGYNYYVDQIAIIDGVAYYFDSTGYMFVGTIVFQTDESGALKHLSTEN